LFYNKPFIDLADLYKKVNQTKMKQSNYSNLVNGNWDEQKVKLQVVYPILKDSDLEYKEGKKNEMLIKIQSRLGKTREELATLIASL
jgi:uncharacterized protein YjbJ (UPF0337 family)